MATGIENRFVELLPLLNHHTRRELWRQTQERRRDLKLALGATEARVEPVFPGHDARNAERYLSFPVAAALARRHEAADGHEALLIPNLGPEEIEVRLEDYVDDSSFEEEGMPAFREPAEFEVWSNAVRSREREQAKIFGVAPRFVLVDPSFEQQDWLGSFLVLSPREAGRPITVFTSGLCDPDLLGATTRLTRGYELYVQTAPGGERWALNLLAHLVRTVVVEGEDHLAALRAVHNVVLESVTVPGLETDAAFVLGVRSHGVPRALPISGGSSKLVPVTFVHPEEVAFARSDGVEQLEALLVDEGVGVLSDPERPPVTGTRRRSRWRFW